MYVLLSGRWPFHDSTDEQTIRMVRKGTVSLSGGVWENVSEDANKLVRALLAMQPEERLTAQQALNHQWMAGNTPRPGDAQLPGSLVENLREFVSHSRLKQVALQVIARQLSESRIASLRGAFLALDANGDGIITASELGAGLEQCAAAGGGGVVSKELRELVAQLAADGSAVDYSEFVAAALDRKHYIEEDVCWAAFRVFDRDGDGKITRAELRDLVGGGGGDLEETIGSETIAEIVKEMDRDGDGQIDFQEFMQMMRGGGGGGAAASASGGFCRASSEQGRGV